jgi:polysaccharide biosynthesis protein PslG
MRIQTHIIKFIFIGLFFFLFSISCSSTSKKSSNKVTVHPDFIGIVAGMAIEEYPLLNVMRPVWVRKVFNWHQIERQKDNFDFSFYDNFVNNAKANEKKILAGLAYSTPWINNGKIKDYISRDDLKYFINYVEVTVKRYKGKIDAWEIWNEPNWLFWKGTDKEFFELSRLTADKIREIDPDAYIVGGSFQRLPHNFIKNMNRAGAMENLNALSFHPYDVNPKASIRLLDDFFKLASKIDFKGDIWISEMGYPTSGWYPSMVSLKNLPSYVIKTIAPAAACGTRVFIWYDFIDSYKFGEYPSKFNSELHFGLVYADFTRKSGAWAYELCARYIPGTQYNPDIPLKEGLKSNVVTLCFTGNESDTNTLIIWNDVNIKQKIKVAIPATITIHDISSSDNYSLQDEAILEISDKPVFITWQGSSVPHVSSIKK